MAALLIYGIVSYVRMNRKLADAVLTRDNIYETDVIESSGGLGTPWVWTYTVKPVFIAEGVWSEAWPEDRELPLAYEQIEQLTLFLNTVRQDEIYPGRSGPMGRSVSLTTYYGTYTLTFDGGIVALGFDDETAAHYPIPEEDPSPSWVIHNDALYAFLDALGQEETTREVTEEVSGARLTLDDVRLLAEKGEELDWEDFDGYAYRDVGSGLYIRYYEIDGTFAVMIGGVPDVRAG